METRTKVWLAEDGVPIIGAGKVTLLKTIDQERSLLRASKKLGVSYKHAWNVLKKMNERVGCDVVTTVRGGRDQGTFLTEYGKKLIEEYESHRIFIDEVLAEKTSWEHTPLQINTNTIIPGRIVGLKKGRETTRLQITVDPSVLTSIVTSDASDELDLKEGDEIFAVIKATEILISKDDPGLGDPDDVDVMFHRQGKKGFDKGQIS